MAPRHTERWTRHAGLRMLSLAPRPSRAAGLAAAGGSTISADRDDVADGTTTWSRILAQHSPYSLSALIRFPRVRSIAGNRPDRPFRTNPSLYIEDLRAISADLTLRVRMCIHTVAKGGSNMATNRLKTLPHSCDTLRHSSVYDASNLHCVIIIMRGSDL